MEDQPDARHQDEHTHQAVDHGGDAGQEADGGFQDGFHLRGRNLGQIHGGEEADGHADDDGAGGAVDAGQDEGQDAVGGLCCGGRPGSAKEEGHQADLPNGRNAGDDQVYGNHENTGHGDET